MFFHIPVTCQKFMSDPYKCKIVNFDTRKLRNVFYKKLYTVHMISAICEMYLAHLCTLSMKGNHLEPQFLLKWFGTNVSEIKCPHNYIGLIMHFVAFQRLCTSWVSKTWIYGKAWSLFQEYQTTNNFIGFRWIWH